MAPQQGSSENRSVKKYITCEICNKKVVNGVKCNQCEAMLHVKCAQTKDNSDLDTNTCICNVCEGGDSLDKTLKDDNTNISEIEVKYILKENKLLKKLLKEMEDKNLLLTENLNYLSQKSAVSDGECQSTDGSMLPKNQPLTSGTSSKTKKQITKLPTEKVYNLQINEQMAPIVHQNKPHGNVNIQQINNSNEDVDNGFTLVKKKKLRNERPQIIGTKANTNEFQSASKKAWLFLGRIKPNTHENTILDYLKNHLDLPAENYEENFTCTKLQIRSENSCFKVGADYTLLQQLQNPDF